MDKKDFLKGIIAGALAVSLSVGAFVYFNGYFPGQSEAVKKIKIIEDLLDSRYVDEVDKEAMYEAMYKAMAESVGDKYTKYMSAEEYEEYMNTTNGTFYGIGAYMAENKETGFITIVSVQKDSPADKAGIRVGDRVITVDDIDIRGFSLDEAVAVTKGKEGTTVKLTILRPSTEETLIFEIEREEINKLTVYHEMLDDIGYIRMTGFKKNTYNEFVDAYNEILGKGAKGLIVDVRNNPGGLFKVAREISDELVGEGVYVYTIDKDGKKEEYVSDSKQIEIPLCVLVNEYSASSSEVFAGAVKGMDAGKLVGTTTYGKGLVQALIDLYDGSGLKVTIQKYYTPDGICIHGEGLTPDYEVELPEGFTYKGQIDLENDTQLLKAIDVINNEK